MQQPTHIELNTIAGNIKIEGPVTIEQLENFTINPRLSNFRNAQRQFETLKIIADTPEGMVYISRIKQEIIGYVVFHRPNSFYRWSKHPKIIELGAIEVSPQYKQQKIATNLLACAFQNNIMEEYIIISTEFYQHWDLKNTNLNILSYQKMLVKLFGSVGFRKRRTDDPDILEHPANMLMVRFGSSISQHYYDAFEILTYQKSLVE